MEKIDYNDAVEIAPNVFWVGYNIETAWFRSNPYLIVEGDEAALIDPGSIIDFEIVRRKVESIIPIKNLRYIILQHQDPDICGGAAEFEKLTTLLIITSERAAIFCRHYGITSFSDTVDGDNQTLSFKTGRKLRFFF